MRLVVLAAALAAATFAPAATADVSDGGGAILTNLLDNKRYQEDEQSANVTCDVMAGGRDLVQRLTYGVGEVYGQDTGFGQGECASLTDKKFDCTVTVWLEYWVSSGPLAGTYQPIPGTTRSATGRALDGVCTTSIPTTLMTYVGGSQYLNTYHQAHATISNTLPGTEPRHDLSPVWYMIP